MSEGDAETNHVIIPPDQVGEFYDLVNTIFDTDEFEVVQEGERREFTARSTEGYIVLEKKEDKPIEFYLEVTDEDEEELQEIAPPFWTLDEDGKLANVSYDFPDITMDFKQFGLVLSLFKKAVEFEKIAPEIEEWIIEVSSRAEFADFGDWEEVTEEEAQSVLNDTSSEDPKRLKDRVTAEEMLPIGKVKATDSLTLYFSKVVSSSSDGRPHCLVYSKVNDEQAQVHMFYRSISHATWKLLAYHEEDGWLGKPIWGEHLSNAPIQVQKVLDQLPHNLTPGTQRESFYNGVVVPKGIGSARHKTINFDEESIIKPPESWYQDSYSNHDPEEIQFNDPDDMPDFDEVEDSWTFKSAIYGSVEARVFHSVNHRLRYLFYTTRDGDSWISSAEHATPEIRLETGLAQNPVNVSPLDIPLVEHERTDEAHYIDIRDDFHAKVGLFQRLAATDKER